jgi:hypothetical protein
MDDSERLRLEYDAAAGVVRDLTEVRFKLLALVPTLAGVVVALASSRTKAVELLAVGLLGATATAGVLVYELRNAQIRRVAQDRVRTLEAQFFAGGTLSVEPRTLGPFTIGHRLGVGLVYGAAFGGWGYLVGWAALRALDVGSARAIGLALGAALGLAAVPAIERLEAPS